MMRPLQLLLYLGGYHNLDIVFRLMINRWYKTKYLAIGAF